MWRQIAPCAWRGAPVRSLWNHYAEALVRHPPASQHLLLRGVASRQAFALRVNHNPIRRSTAWRASHLSTDTNATGSVHPEPKRSPPAEQGKEGKRSLADDVKEYKERAATGNTASFDSAVIDSEDANVFPRIKTTSLSTKRVVIHDEASKKSVTLVLVAFRSFADDQLQSWKRAFETVLPEGSGQWYDVTVNESFGSQALSGFIQRIQRSRTDAALHDYYVAFNSKAREPLEDLLPSRNRMFGYVLLLDRQSRVRFRGSGMASEQGLEAMLSCANALIGEDQK